MGRDSFIFYRSFYEALAELKPLERLKVYDAICNLALDGEEAELKGISKAIFSLIKPQVEANFKKYENGKTGGRPKKQNQTETKTKPKQNQTETKTKPNENVNENDNENENVNDKKKAPTGLKKKQAFSPPSLTEVKSYCSERGNNIDPQGFIDFYEAKGWMIGKNKMKDWKAAVRTWERKEREDSGGRTTDGSVKQNQTPWDELLHTEYI